MASLANFPLICSLKSIDFFIKKIEGTNAMISDKLEEIKMPKLPKPCNGIKVGSRDIDKNFWIK